MRVRRGGWAMPLLAALSIGCSPTEPPPAPADIDIILRGTQSGAVGEALPFPLLVRVEDDRGAGFEGATVSFSLTSGSGIFDDRFEDCSPSPGTGDPLSVAMVDTDADGYAWVSMTAAAFGRTSVAASVDGTSIPPVIFVADVTDPGATVEIPFAYDQEVVAGLLRSHTLDVVVKDGLGKGVPSIPVIWEVTSGAGRLTDTYGCGPSERSTTAVTSRTGTVEDNGVAGYNDIVYEAMGFGVTTVRARPMGMVGPGVTFTVDATLLEIQFYNSSTTGWSFAGPDFSPDVTVPVGATVEWWNRGGDARIVSISAPPGGTAIDSGPLSTGERFRFVPDVGGTWEYVEEITGARATLTAS